MSVRRADAQPAEEFPELLNAIQRWAAKNVLPKDLFEQLADEMKARAFTAAGLWFDHARVDALYSLRDALLDGQSVADWVQEKWKPLALRYGNGLASQSWYVDTVFRTNTQAAYAGGRYSELFSPAAIQRAPFVLFSAIHDSRTRPEHRALDGRVFRKDDAAARRYFPPLGFNCRCQLIELDDEGVKAGGHKVTNGSDIPGLLTDGGEVVGPPPQGWDTDRVDALVSYALAQAPPVSGPAGAPVSKHFKFAGGKYSREIQDVLDLIDSVHGDGTMKVTDLVYAGGDGGFFRWGTSVSKLKVGRDAKHRLVQLVHEIGHKLDVEGIGTLGIPAVGRDAVTIDVVNAIKASKAYQNLVAARAAARDKRYLDYLLGIREAWARAYAQYIAVETGDTTMLEQLNLLRSGALRRNPDSQWSDADFAPIQDAVTRMLKALGWRT